MTTVRVNRTELANFLEVAETTIDRWVAREGCPIENRPGQGKAATYSSGDVVRWWIEREVKKAEARAESGSDDLDALRARKLELDAELRALQLAKEKGEVCNLAELERALSTIVIHCRTQLLALPQRLAPLLVGETDETRLKQVIQAEVRQALTELSNDNVEQILQEVSEW
jgi:phage terminase Nu1 subunit (DNA packaging protein)